MQWRPTCVLDGVRGKVERGEWCGAAVGVEDGPGEGGRIGTGGWDGLMAVRIAVMGVYVGCAVRWWGW